MGIKEYEDVVGGCGLVSDIYVWGISGSWDAGNDMR
jgi:hypothetical protein